MYMENRILVRVTFQELIEFAEIGSPFYIQNHDSKEAFWGQEAAVDWEGVLFKLYIHDGNQFVCYKAIVLKDEAETQIFNRLFDFGEHLTISVLASHYRQLNPQWGSGIPVTNDEPESVDKLKNVSFPLPPNSLTLIAGNLPPQQPVVGQVYWSTALKGLILYSGDEKGWVQVGKP